jgi:DamX protein
MSREKLAYEIMQQISPDKADDMSYAIAQLHKFLEYSAKNTITPVFIIDDADKLPLETLKFILELAALRYLESLFRFVLFSDETLTDRLEDPRLNSLSAGQMYKLHLPALSRHQLKEYLDTRLSSTGEVNTYPFDDDDMDAIYKTSGGLPRGINILACRLMQSRIQPAPAGAGRWKLAAGLAFVAAAGILAYFTLFQAGSGPPTAMPVVQTTRPPVEHPPEAVIPDEETEAPIAIAETDIETAITDDVVPPMTMDFPDNAAEPVIAAIPDEPVNVETPAIVAVESVVPDMPSTTEPIVAGTRSEADSAGTPAVTMTETLENIPIPNRPGFGLNDDNIFNLDSVPEIITGIRGNVWYRTQQPGSYVLQLISASEIRNVESLLEGLPGIQQNLSGYVKYTPSGRPRFLLFYGVYPDQESATQAVESLPPKLKSVKPWPRSVRSITNEIDEVLERIRNQ